MISSNIPHVNLFFLYSDLYFIHVFFGIVINFDSVLNGILIFKFIWEIENCFTESSITDDKLFLFIIDKLISVSVSFVSDTEITLSVFDFTDNLFGVSVTVFLKKKLFYI